MTTRRRQPATVRVPERFTVENAAEVLDQLQARIARRGKVTVDLTDVRTVDSAGLQLLAAVREKLRAENRELVLKGIPEAVVDGARLLGVDALLELA